MVPFENSTHGPVEATLDLLADKEGEFRNISVFGEIFLDINHYLVGFTSGSDGSNLVAGHTTPTRDTPNPPEPRSEPLRDISHVKQVFSHKQAIGQCGPFISTYLKGADLHEVVSTSRGAQMVAASGDFTTAAIASKTAAQVFDLTILAERIQERDDNKTRFLVLINSCHTKLPNGISLPVDLPTAKYFESNSLTTGEPLKESEKMKGLVSFIINHRRVGALADALGVFKTYGFNLLSINPRPNRTEAWQYIFFVEFEGKDEGHMIDNLETALRQLKSCTTYCRWYGCWKMMGILH